MNKRYTADLSLLFVAFIWGTTFVIVQRAINILPPHSFNTIRFFLASLILFLTIAVIDFKSLKNLNLKLIKSGFVLGIFLFAGYAFQTVGLLYTTASKAGFITGLSVVLVPILSVLVLKAYPKWTSLLSVLLAATGLYLLTMTGQSSFNYGDFLVFFCALFFALQIVFTGRYAPNYNSLILAWVQITTVAILSFIFAILFEDFYTINVTSLLTKDLIVALLITSILATAFAFLAQTYFQRYTTPTRVAIIFAMEPVFAALTAYIILKEHLSYLSIIGGLLIFSGMIFAELNTRSFKSIFDSKKSELVQLKLNIEESDGDSTPPD